MIESIQVQNYKQVPYKRNATVEEHGKVRILSFDFNFEEDLKIGDDLVLARIPSGKIRVLNIVLQNDKLGENQEVELLLAPISEFDDVLKEETLLKSQVVLNDGSEFLEIINKITDSILGSYFIIRLSKDLIKDAKIKGYISYIAD